MVRRGIYRPNLAPGTDARVELREIAHMVWKQATPYVRRRLAGVLVLVVISAALTALSPVALKYVVDGVTGNAKGASSDVMLLAALYVLGLWIARAATEVRELVFARARQRIFRTLSECLFSHVMRLPLRFHLDRRTGGVTQTLDNGLEGLRIILHHLVFSYLPVLVELSIVLLVIVRLMPAPFLGLFSGALVCYIAVFRCTGASIASAGCRASAARIDAAAAMTDGLLNYETVKYFAAEALVQERVVSALRRSEAEWAAFYRWCALNGLLVGVIFAAVLAGTALYTTEQVWRGRLTLGDFVLVNSYVLQLVRPVEMIGYAMQGFSRGVAMLSRLVGLFRETTEAGSHEGKGATTGPGLLEFHEVSLSYGLDRPVLRRVSFRVPVGRTLGVVGASGSGKSTIVRLVMRLLEPESGVILLDGVPISAMALEEVRRSIAVVPQDTVLFHDTVRYNIGFGRPGATAREIEEAARIAQLHELIMALPERYDTLVGERGVKLSGGERQRVSIARAVLKSPRIYIFDEATSSLDSRTEQEILRSLRAISKSKTTLVIAHRLSSVVDADEIVVLEEGRIVEHGGHEALLRRNGRYAAFWRAQQGGAAAA